MAVKVRYPKLFEVISLILSHSHSLPLSLRAVFACLSDANWPSFSLLQFVFFPFIQFPHIADEEQAIETALKSVGCSKIRKCLWHIMQTEKRELPLPLSDFRLMLLNTCWLE